MNSLAERLRSQTWPAHKQVEATSFVRALLGGQVDRNGYCLLLASLHPIYAALEAALLRQAQHPVIAPVFNSELLREEPLGSDLDHLHGPAWRDELAAQPAARAYAARIAEIERSEPALLVAHAYVRYLGDLSGGQALRKIVARALGLAPEAGTRFYDFGSPQQVGAMAQRFRSGLDQIEGDPASREAIVSEATDAFRRHGELFEQLDRARSAPSVA
ncbi:biliverdin-producing heme oxygenase [Rhizobacter sp. AJA081-3]|jgi:heme oxygenase|uniref:biliverdin-producing heme oxygenase n=1 Tax=Rhizobacter sp. AJA081-3 TaxID=2753607 RepID=UPI001AE00C0E|nr:biliverdin-producing heme oxygenase [Rhizobacter sp. AJA081-3]QTN24682.1 biliverdin-producing heme oxygenase [Rhizobacter sp. AJA081-3]